MARSLVDRDGSFLAIWITAESSFRSVLEQTHEGMELT